MGVFIISASLFVVILLLVVGFALLVKGADFIVEGSSSVAKKLAVPSIIIGLTIVAMGTSLPETAVSVTASLVDNNTLAISNVVGSNIFNLMFVIGVCSILSTIYVQRETVTRDITFSIICALLLLGLGMIAVGDATGMTLGHFDGILFLILFAGYIGLMIKSAMKARAEGKEVEANDELDAEELKVMSYPKSIIYIVGGAIAIAIGGDLTVDTASRIAIDLGMSQTLVGLTIVSIGTSLPELVTSVVAARKNEVDMAVGNAVGSNIFNILMVLGIASAINPVSLIRENVIDIIILVAFSVVVWIFAATKKKISRKEGIAMELPVKTKAKGRKIEKRTVLVFHDSDTLAIQKRPDKGLLAGLYELPNLEGWLSQQEVIEYSKSIGLSPIRIKKLPVAKHIFSHVEWQMKGYEIQGDELEKNCSKEMIFAKEEVLKEKYSIPSAFEAYCVWKQK